MYNIIWSLYTLQGNQRNKPRYPPSPYDRHLSYEVWLWLTENPIGQRSLTTVCGVAKSSDMTVQSERERNGLLRESEVKVNQSCPTLCDPMDYTVHGILQARILEWIAFPFSRGSSQPRDWIQVSHIAGRFFNQVNHKGSKRELNPENELSYHTSPLMSPKC